jgi:hypothetical protein
MDVLVGYFFFFLYLPITTSTRRAVPRQYQECADLDREAQMMPAALSDHSSTPPGSLRLSQLIYHPQNTSLWLFRVSCTVVATQPPAGRCLPSRFSQNPLILVLAYVFRALLDDLTISPEPPSWVP